MFFFLLFPTVRATFLANNTYNQPENVSSLASALTFRIKREIVPVSELEKRDSVIYDTVRVHYLVQFAMGTPHQNLDGKLDMSRPGTYIYSPSGNRCHIKKCVTFHRIDSQTFYSDGTTFRVKIGKWRNIKAYWGEDTLTINSDEIKAFKFMGVSTSPYARSVIGIGPVKHNHIHDDTKRESETNFLVQLKKSGFISSVTYSLWVGSNENDGLIIFGHYDALYPRGTIYIFPLIQKGKSMGFYINLDSIHLIRGDNEFQVLFDNTLLAEIDFTSDNSKLPREILDPINVHLGVSGVNNNFICSSTEPLGGIGLVFSGVEYSLSFHAIALSDRNYPHKCVAPFSLGKKIVLGANIFKSFYAIFDLERDEIGLALVKHSDELQYHPHSIITLTDGIPGEKAPFYFKPSEPLSFEFSSTNQTKEEKPSGCTQLNDLR